MSHVQLGANYGQQNPHFMATLAGQLSRRNMINGLMNSSSNNNLTAPIGFQPGFPGFGSQHAQSNQGLQYVPANGLHVWNGSRTPCASSTNVFNQQVPPIEFVSPQLLQVNTWIRCECIWADVPRIAIELIE
ncbi:unnamed protein product [Caenorhabditis angaria]|uniref:Uncharacterized protein n=1 Tax=Caenorhabditis angaria TaxID=860376 RepID=A0A9P1ITU8_9PELO|nr:unnamed protein product [Caenorhabditis angaria]CAI5451113.1 unnamed protein product [Caenorhabditis angaria]